MKEKINQKKSELANLEVKKSFLPPKSLNKLLIIFFVTFINLSFFSGVVSASYPNYILNEIHTTSLINGKNEIGDFLFIWQDYVPEIHLRNNFNNFTAQRFDVFTWQSSQSVRVIPPIGNEQILVNGNSFTFMYQGQYIIQSVVNSSVSGVITVLPEDENRISVDFLSVPNGMRFNVTPQNFLLTSEQIVKIVVDVDDELEPRDYQVTYQVTSGVRKTNYTRTFRLLENIDWEITENTITNKSVKTGESLFYGYIDLKNTGNTDVVITVTKTGNETHLIGIPQSQKMYKKSNLRMNFQVQVPSSQRTGDYKINITIKGGEREEVIPLTISVLDSIPPVIESIDFSTDKVFVDNEITVVATDNDDVDRVVMKYDTTTLHLLKDGNVFRITHKFVKLSRYSIEFCAYDMTNNTDCVVVNKTFIKDQVINNSQTNLNLPTRKVGVYSEVKLFDMIKPVDSGVIVQLVQLNTIGTSLPNYQPSVRLVYADGTIRSFTQLENQVVLQKEGRVFLEVRSDYVGDFEGMLRVLVPEHIEEVQDIYFKVAFKDYDVPEDFSLSWFDNRMIHCRVSDTGDLSTSKYVCELEFPIGISKEDISFPTTAREKKKLDEDIQLVRDEMQRNRKRSASIITLLSSIIIILGLVGYYFLEIYPYSRTKSKIKEN